MPCPWTKSVVERGWQLAKQNELSCLLAALSPVEMIETHWASAQGVCVSESASSHDAHLPFLQLAGALDCDDVEEDPSISKKQDAWDPLPAAEDQGPRDLVLQQL